MPFAILRPRLETQLSTVAVVPVKVVEKLLLLSSWFSLPSDLRQPRAQCCLACCSVEGCNMQREAKNQRVKETRQGLQKRALRTRS